MFLSFPSTSQNGRLGKPTQQLVPNEVPAKGNTIIQWRSNIPGRTATEQLFINGAELLDQQRMLPHQLATLTGLSDGDFMLTQLECSL